MLLDRSRERRRRGPERDVLLRGSKRPDRARGAEGTDALAKGRDRADRARALVLDEGSDLREDDAQRLAARDLLEDHPPVAIEEVSPRQRVFHEAPVLPLALKENVRLCGRLGERVALDQEGLALHEHLLQAPLQRSEHGQRSGSDSEYGQGEGHGESAAAFPACRLARGRERKTEDERADAFAVVAHRGARDARLSCRRRLPDRRRKAGPVQDDDRREPPAGDEVLDRLESAVGVLKDEERPIAAAARLATASASRLAASSARASAPARLTTRAVAAIRQASARDNQMRRTSVISDHCTPRGILSPVASGRERREAGERTSVALEVPGGVACRRERDVALAERTLETEDRRIRELVLGEILSGGLAERRRASA